MPKKTNYHTHTTFSFLEHEIDVRIDATKVFVEASTPNRGRSESSRKAEGLLRSPHGKETCQGPWVRQQARTDSAVGST